MKGSDLAPRIHQKYMCWNEHSKSVCRTLNVYVQCHQTCLHPKPQNYPEIEPTYESISSQSILGFSLILEQFANKVFSALSDFPTTYSWFARKLPLKLITVPR